MDDLRFDALNCWLGLKTQPYNRLRTRRGRDLNIRP
jgi:hypothetical protein